MVGSPKSPQRDGLADYGAFAEQTKTLHRSLTEFPMASTNNAKRPKQPELGALCVELRLVAEQRALSL